MRPSERGAGVLILFFAVWSGYAEDVLRFEMP